MIMILISTGANLTSVTLTERKTERRCSQRRTIISSVPAHSSNHFPAIIAECSNNGGFLQRGHAGEDGNASDDGAVPDEKLKTVQ